MTNPKEKEIRERFLNEFIKPEMLNKPYVIADWWLKEIDTLLHSDREAVREEIKKMWNYPCSCAERQEFCVHDYSTMHAVLSLLSPNK